MKIETKYHAGGAMSIDAFADTHGLTMEVVERPRRLWQGNENFRYYASFKYTEVSEPNVLVSAYGDGKTPEQAIRSYAREIAGRRIVVDAFRPTRREIEVPNELTT